MWKILVFLRKIKWISVGDGDLPIKCLYSREYYSEAPKGAPLNAQGFIHNLLNPVRFNWYRLPGWHQHR